MAADEAIERLITLKEIDIALQLHFRGVNQQTIARILKKRNAWVNQLLRSIPSKR